MPRRRPDSPAARAGGQRRQAASDDTVSLENTLSMTLKTACRITGFSTDAMYDLIHEGEIQSFTMGHRRFLIVQSIRDYLARRAAEPLTIRAGPNSRKMGARDGLVASPAAKP